MIRPISGPVPIQQGCTNQARARVTYVVTRSPEPYLINPAPTSAMTVSASKLRPNLSPTVLEFRNQTFFRFKGVPHQALCLWILLAVASFQ